MRTGDAAVFDAEGRRVCDDCAALGAIEQSVQAARANPAVPRWALPASVALGGAVAVLVTFTYVVAGFGAAAYTLVTACVVFFLGAVLALRLRRA